MTRVTLSQQTVYFLASIALGAVLAMVYDLLRAFRMLIRCGHVHLFLSDVLFFFLCGVVTSLFSLPFNKGDVRAFILFGEAVGFLAYRLTLGSLFGRFYAGIARLLRRFIQKICEKLKKFYDFLLKAGSVLLYNITAIVGRSCRTAVSGAHMLAAGIVLGHSHSARYKASRHSPRKREGTAQDDQGIPQGRDLRGKSRKKYDKNRCKTRKKREKTRRTDR